MFRHNVKFFWKSWKLFLQFYDFFKKSCRFLHENLTVFTGKSKLPKVSVKMVIFFHKNCHILCIKRLTSSVSLWVILKNWNYLTDYARLWIYFFITFMWFTGIKCLIYSHNMSEKYWLDISTCPEKMHLISLNDLTLQHVGRKCTSFH